MKREILKNQNVLRSELDLSPSDANLFINGMQFDLDYTDIFTLLDHIRDEQNVMERLHQLGQSSLFLIQTVKNNIRYKMTSSRLFIIFIKY